MPSPHWHRHHRVGTGLGTSLADGSGTACLPCEAHKATDVLELCCSVVIPSSLGAVCHLLIISKHSLCSSCYDVRREGDSPSGDGPGWQVSGILSDLTCGPYGLTLFSYTVGAVCLLTWWIWKLYFFHRS